MPTPEPEVHSHSDVVARLGEVRNRAGSVPRPEPKPEPKPFRSPVASARLRSSSRSPSTMMMPGLSVLLHMGAICARPDPPSTLAQFEETQTKLIGANSALTGLKNLRIFWLSITRCAENHFASQH